MVNCWLQRRTHCRTRINSRSSHQLTWRTVDSRGCDWRACALCTPGAQRWCGTGWWLHRGAEWAGSRCLGWHSESCSDGWCQYAADTWRGDGGRLPPCCFSHFTLEVTTAAAAASKQIDISHSSDQTLNVCSASRPNVICRDTEIECHQMGFLTGLTSIWAIFGFTIGGFS